MYESTSSHKAEIIKNNMYKLHGWKMYYMWL